MINIKTIPLDSMRSQLDSADMEVKYKDKDKDKDKNKDYPPVFDGKSTGLADIEVKYKDKDTDKDYTSQLN